MGSNPINHNIFYLSTHSLMVKTLIYGIKNISSTLIECERA